MSEIDEHDVKPRVDDDHKNVLEQKYIEEYLQSKGYRRADLSELPQDQAKQLMREACQYAGLKLAEMEAKGRFRKKIHF